MKGHACLRKGVQILLASIVFLVSACQSNPPASPTNTAAAPIQSEGKPSTTLDEASTPKPLIQSKDWEFQIDKNLAYYVEHAPLAGATIAIRLGDERMFLRAYGLASLTPSINAEKDTVYEIGEITAQFTAAAILRLAEQHRLRLDDPITAYLPSFPPFMSTIQIRHLLNHTSGIFEPVAYYTLLEDPDVYTPQEILDKAVEEWDLQSMQEMLEKTPDLLESLRKPGTTWSYSSFGYFLLGMIIEAASGQPYGDYLQENIFIPAGMKSTHYCPDEDGPIANGYIYENRAFKQVNLNMSVAFSAAGLCSSAEDLLAWENALVRGDVISMNSYLEMITPISPEKVTENYAPYGYGVFIEKDQGRKIIHHGGYVNGTQSYMIYYPEYDLTIVMLTNTTTPGTFIYSFIRSNVVPTIFDNDRSK